MPIIYKKRVRTKFNQEQVPRKISKFYFISNTIQLDVLEATFQQHRYPTVDIVDDLVEQLNLPTQKITVKIKVAREIILCLIIFQIWFQNRRARLKKTQQKLDIQPSFEKETQQQYDSGIHLVQSITTEKFHCVFFLLQQDEDASHDSPASPPMNSISQWPPPPLFMTNPSAYYLPNPPYPFYNPMWSNFGYKKENSQLKKSKFPFILVIHLHHLQQWLVRLIYPIIEPIIIHRKYPHHLFFKI